MTTATFIIYRETLADMPVTLGVAWRPAENWTGVPATTRGDILRAVNMKHYLHRYKSILQTSIGMPDYLITGSPNGLVHAALAAYKTRHHLTIRPEDVWFSILSQLSFYINIHAAELLGVFVSNEGIKQLAIEVTRDNRSRNDGPRKSNASTRQIAGVLGDHIKDPALREWVMPSFSTTTIVDRAVAAALFIGAMQTEKCPTSRMSGGALPSVTLLGEAADYWIILQRLDMLERLRGCEPHDMAQLLRPVLRHMIATFETGVTPRTVSFWNNMIQKWKPDGNKTFLSGWITAFCYWSAEGVSNITFNMKQRGGAFVLDGVAYPCLDSEDIPPSSAAVPVVVDIGDERLDCTLLAASAAIYATDATPEQVAASPNQGVLKRRGRTAIQPVSGWFLCENKYRKRSSIHQILHGNRL
ncbi:hypothetical protein LMH87_004670 [Akanthomyces muscarius]|uniref:Uncharacterized protein n=1 Tax=Akanthomyces muscarius TaxID=2231603 RepID=A0A9W8Q3R0_AKAMU|nr:hypothetical protein LMH87_004670 [Akanthomyces muscarius]KAJ4145838.1 hypothetical protein LMH87_004670 [Akanthomyces muscarius]